MIFYITFTRSAQAFYKLTKILKKKLKDFRCKKGILNNLNTPILKIKRNNILSVLSVTRGY